MIASGQQYQVDSHIIDPLKIVITGGGIFFVHSLCTRNLQIFNWLVIHADMIEP